MSNISYTLMHFNRWVTVQHNDMVATMRYRDFLNLVQMHECELSKDESIIIGPNEILSIKVDSLN